MKSFKYIFLITTFILILSKVVFSQNYLSYPESVVYEPNSNNYFVSNQETGTIVSIDSTGYQEIFASGMLTAIGITLYENTIYVVGQNEIYGFSVLSGEQTFYIAVATAIKLNDITVDEFDNIYSSDVLGDKIYKIQPTDSTYNIVADEGIYRPNGILYEKEKNRLLICSWRTHSYVQSLDISNFTIDTLLFSDLSYCDGFTRDLQGNYYISEWETNSIHKFDSLFMFSGEIVYSNPGSPADIFYNTYKNEIAIPLVMSHQLDILPLNSTGISEGETSSYSITFLDQNYPNPFNPVTKIKYTISETQFVTLKVFDLLGNEVANLVGEEKPQGIYEVEFNASNLPSGLYFYSLTGRDFYEARKMILVK